MAHDPDDIVRQAKQVDERYQAIRAYVQGAEAQTATAYEAEFTVFRAVLALGAQLLLLFFMTRARSDSAPVTAEGQRISPHRWRATKYFSVFGPIRFARRYYRLPDGRGCFPLDAALSLPERCYSMLLRSWLELAVTNAPYDEAVGLLEHILGKGVCKHALERVAVEDAADVDAFYEQLPPPPATDEGSILVVQVDGKGVRMGIEEPGQKLRTEKREAVVTAIYSIQPHAMDADAVSDSLAGKPIETDYVPPKTPRPEPVAKQLRATLAGKDVAFQRLVRQVQQREGPHVTDRVALTDGDQALHRRVQEHLPGFTLILDVVHVRDYVQAASAALLGETYPHLKDYVACRLLEILTGQLDRTLATFEDRKHRMRTLTAAEEQQVATTIGYLRNNAEFMHYDTYLAKGWPIATGIAEGGCGHLVKDRMERAGMKWCPPGAQAVLDLRAVRTNDHWEAYQGFHRQCEHRRLYPSTPMSLPVPEEQALAIAA